MISLYWVNASGPSAALPFKTLEPCFSHLLYFGLIMGTVNTGRGGPSVLI